jgi:HSP20 family protein
MATTMEQARHQDVSPQAGAEARAPAEREVFLLPPIDVVEDGNGITLYADMPGVERDGLTVEVEGDTLLIEGRSRLALPEGARPVYAEQRSVSYRRRFTLSGDLERDRIDAKLAHGVLTLKIGKTEAARPRRIAVREA